MANIIDAIAEIGYPEFEIGIASIEKTGTEGLVDTYTITFTDGSTQTYTVTNGAKGDTGAQGEQGATGATGNGIASITKIGTEGLVDTYRITFTDGTHFDYTVTNGEGGSGGEQEPLIVEINTATSTATSTYAQILEAVNDGRAVYAKPSSYNKRIPLAFASTTEVLFIDHNANWRYKISSSNVITHGMQFEDHTLDSNNAPTANYVFSEMESLRNSAESYADSAVGDAKLELELELAEKQNTLTFDTSPTANSTNPVTSGGVYTAIESAKDGLIQPIYFTTENHVQSVYDAVKTGKAVFLSEYGNSVHFYGGQYVFSGYQEWIDANQVTQKRILFTGSQEALDADDVAYGKVHCLIGNFNTDTWTYCISDSERIENMVYDYYKPLTEVVTMTSTDTTATLEENYFYVWPEMSTLTITCPSTGGEYAFRFTSGSTATTLTISGITMPDDFSVEANRTYEINILEGYGVAVSWEVNTSASA